MRKEYGLAQLKVKRRGLLSGLHSVPEDPKVEMPRQKRVIYYLVAYVDILGQKKELAKLKEFPTTQEKESEFIKAISDSYGFVKAFRDSFNEFLHAVSPKTSTESSSDIEKSLYKMKIAKVQTHVISDTVILSAPLYDEDIKCPSSGIFQILGSVASTFLLSLAFKKACRGGIEIGPSIEMGQGDIYGYALLEAHRLESEVAEYPRIVIGNELVQYLSLAKESVSSNFYDTFNRAMSAICIDELISKDSDDQYVLDYLGEGFKKYIGSEEATKENVLQAYEFVNKELYKFRKENKEAILVDKYSRLKEYFEKNIARWRE